MNQYKIVEISANIIEIQTIDGQIIGSIHPFHINVKDNAEFIGRALNRHDDLVEALERCKNCFDMLLDPTTIDSTSTINAWAQATETMHKVRQVLSKAKGDI